MALPWNWIVDETRSLDDYAGSLIRSCGGA
jgi:hypothetical protein